MPLRFLCPQCHASIDPCRLESGDDGVHDYHICPECDAVLALYPPEVSRSNASEMPREWV